MREFPSQSKVFADSIWWICLSADYRTPSTHWTSCVGSFIPKFTPSVWRLVCRSIRSPHSFFVFVGNWVCWASLPGLFHHWFCPPKVPTRYHGAPLFQPFWCWLAETVFIVPVMLFSFFCLQHSASFIQVTVNFIREESSRTMFERVMLNYVKIIRLRAVRIMATT